MAIQSVLTPPDQSAARSTKSSQDGQGVQRSIANPPSEDIPFTVKDIGGGNLPTLLNSLLEEQLNDPQGHQTRHLPALFFSDDIGLSMWSKITHLPRYYQTRDEIELLRAHGDEIVEQLRMGVSDSDGLIVVDLGAGSVVMHLICSARLANHAQQRHSKGCSPSYETRLNGCTRHVSCTRPVTIVTQESNGYVEVVV